MIRTESNNIVDGVVREAGETNANVLTSTRKVTLEAFNTKHGDANLTLKCIIINQVESENSCCYTKTQDYSGEMNQDVDGHTRTVGIVEDLKSPRRARRLTHTYSQKTTTQRCSSDINETQRKKDTSYNIFTYTS